MVIYYADIEGFRCPEIAEICRLRAAPSDRVCTGDGTVARPAGGLRRRYRHIALGRSPSSREELDRRQAPAFSIAAIRKS